MPQAPSSSAEQPAGLAPMLQAALDGLTAHVCVLDAEARICWVNQAWVRFACDNGANPGQVGLGTNYLAVCGGSGRDAQYGNDFAGGLRDVLGGRSERFETEYPCHSPTSLRWFEVSAVAIEWAGQRGALITHQPVTERKLAEARQRERHKLESLGTLAGGVAHDFNNVLSVVLSNAAMVLEDGHELGEGSRQRMHLLWDAAQSARALAGQILSFSRKRALQARPQPLGPMVRSLLPMLRATLPAQARVETRLADRGLAVLVDRSEFEQLLINLCLNAAQALQGRPGLVTVSLDVLPAGAPLRRRAGLDGEAAFVHLTVHDNGQGMDAATRERIFEPFFTTKPEGQGTGLGLAVVRGVAERRRVAIVVDSEPGVGTTFHLLWPSTGRTAEDTADAASRPPSPRPAPVPAPEPPTPVLVVDDDEVVGITLQALLERGGYAVTRVLRPAEALAALAASPEGWALLLSDQSMPEMSGLDLARQVNGIAPGLPVVLVTGWAGDGLPEQAQAAGVRALVNKEQAFEDLLPTLAFVLLQDRRVTPASSQA